MAKTEDLTVEILQQIRDELVTTRNDLGARIDATNVRLESVERRQTESEIRVSTELVAVARAVDGVRDLLRERLDDRDRIDDHERRLIALERRKRAS